MRSPYNAPITLFFGATTYPYSPGDPHKGVDAAGGDWMVYAPFSGKVIVRPNNGDDGNAIYMYNGSEEMHGMLHNERFLVGNGVNVVEGQLIAVMGATGRVDPPDDRGRHGHWCVKRNGQFINPLSLLPGGRGAGECKEYVMDAEDAKEVGYRLPFYREPENDNVWRGLVGKKPSEIAKALRGSQEYMIKHHILEVAYPAAMNDLIEARTNLQHITAELNALRDSVDINKQQFETTVQAANACLDQLSAATTRADELKRLSDSLQAEKAQDMAVGNSFTRWIGSLFGSKNK